MQKMAEAEGFEFVTNSTPPVSNISTTAEAEISPVTLETYIIVGVSAFVICVLFIIVFALLIRKLRARFCFDKRLLETYSSVNYDDETIDDELDNCDDLLYTSCKLHVGNDLGIDSDMTNSEPEYDCMSVDVSVSANQPSMNWTGNDVNAESLKVAQSLKTLPPNFWRQ